ncbi:ankyrin-2 [Iris pallida]|uniref:Ankyrin-2 n=1 Tax=Iris pallida TaxID=29817 RepID=A0AAX6DMR0_IRIPA|nr:ankyrin-2 [Iris pallida]
MLLDHHSPDALHCGRSLLHHAILCSNPGAAEALLASGADHELPVAASRKYEFRPVHMAARLGQHAILRSLCDRGCDPDSRTGSGDTALMLCARYKRKDCVRVLVDAGADLSLVNDDGASAESVAASCRWRAGFRRAVLDAIRSGAAAHAAWSNASLFSYVMFAAGCGDAGALEALLVRADVDVDRQDESGFSPVMVAAREGHVDSFRVLVFGGANAGLANKAGETAVGLCRLSGSSELFEQVMLELTLEKGDVAGFYALHCAARRGDLLCVHLLSNRGHDVDLADEDGYTPLMLAAREGHAKVCQLLVACGAKCDVRTDGGGETALSLARKNGMAEAEGVVLDELARVTVSSGGRVRKHTKRGKGSPHAKTLAMVGATGVLRWGKSRRRNVVCKEAEVGGSRTFQKNRRRKGDALVPGLFRVVTTKAKEFHFVCEGGDDVAELWVRGITNATNAAVSAKGDIS